MTIISGRIDKIIVVENTGESLIDTVSTVTKIVSPASTSQELDFEPDIGHERVGETVGIGKIDSNGSFFANFLGEGLASKSGNLDGIGNILGVVHLSRDGKTILLIGRQLEPIPRNLIGNRDANHGRIDRTLRGNRNGDLRILERVGIWGFNGNEGQGGISGVPGAGCRRDRVEEVAL